MNMLPISVLIVALSYLAATTDASRYRARHCAGTLRHVHLAVGRDPSSEMTVSFSSVRSFHVHPVGGVLIGTSPDELNVYIEEQEPGRYYNATPESERLPHYYSPLNHHVRITDLDPSTTYYYKCVVRPKNEKYPMPNSGSGAALRGSARDSVIRDHDFAEFEVEVMRAEERPTLSHDDAEDEEDDNRRRLDLNYYDGSLARCPPPKKIRSFQTAPKLGELDNTKISKTTQKPSLRFAYLGDLGQFEHSQENIMHLVAHQNVKGFNAITLAGDIAYTGYDNRRWDSFFDFLDDVFIHDEVPMHVVAGNHDIEKYSNSNDIFVAYESRFHMPQVEPAQLGKYEGSDEHLNLDHPPYPLKYEFGNSYYAFSYGISHHIFLNAYSSMDPGSTQYKWFLEELKSINREVTPWVIVTFHVPVYNAFDVHHEDVQIMAAKQHIEPLLVEYKVNLVVAGHIHAYQRTHNVNMDQLDPSGPMHVVVGAGGRQCKASFLSEEPDSVIAVRDATRYGYATFEIFNETHAQWEWIVTGHSEYQDLNKVWKSNVTLPKMESNDSVIVVNQYFL